MGIRSLDRNSITKVWPGLSALIAHAARTHGEPGAPRGFGR